MVLVKTCILLLLLVSLKTNGSRIYPETSESTIHNGDITTLNTRTSLDTPSEMEDETNPSVALEKFLKTYEVEKPRNRYFSNNNRWDLKPTQKLGNPYDDKKGWVSLEPIPWSVSKISKWHSRYKPQESSNFEFNMKKPYKQKPPPSTYHYQQNYNDFPTDEDDYEVGNSYYDNKRPSISRPAIISSFAQKLHIKNTISDPDYSSDIITDGMPADFPEHHNNNYHHHQQTPPEHNYNRRQSLTTESSMRPSHPFSGDVLPPLKGSKVNMTTSHGGLLQVDSSFQTVEQAAQKYKRQKQKPKQKVSSTTTRRPRTIKPFPVKRKEAATTSVTTRNNAPDTSAVLAAVGAGMIPATMAMLLPMAMGGRKKRETRSVTGRPSVVEITLPRSL